MGSRGTMRSPLEVCADCGAPDPKWASVNRGVLVCDECCSVHRSLGRHISQIRSLKKGVWPSSLLAMVHQLSASGANNIWEHSLLDPTHNRTGRRKPNPRDNLHPTKSDFIRAKYQFLTYTKKYTDEELGSVQDLSKQLHSSVRTGNLETSLRLLSLGADPNFYNADRGNYALHVAAQSGQILQVELLIVYGADPGQKDSRDRTPSDYAREENHQNICHRLVESQYELTDRLTLFLCSKKPDHRLGHHFLIPEMGDCSIDYSELAKAAKQKLQALPNHLFEELAMDVHDEVERRDNESIWRSTQSQSAANARPSLHFLPVNSEFSTTRNQGRQKLARFNKRELFTLIIDVLTDTKRRQLGGSIGAPLPASPAVFNSPSMTRRLQTSSFSDDEPAYDSVASDEDYSSVGDRHSLKETPINELPLEEAAAEALPPSEATSAGGPLTSSVTISMSSSSGTGSTSASATTPTIAGSGGRSVVSAASAAIGTGGDRTVTSPVLISGVTSPVQRDSPVVPELSAHDSMVPELSSHDSVVSLEQYRELQSALISSETRLKQMAEQKKGLEREMQLMQRTVQRLAQENAEIKKGSQMALDGLGSPGTTTASGPAIPALPSPGSLANGRGAASSARQPALSGGAFTPIHQAPPAPSASADISRPNSYGKGRPMSMFEPRRTPTATLNNKSTNEPQRRLSGLHSASCNNLGPEKKAASRGSMVDSDNDNGSLYDNDPAPSTQTPSLGPQRLPMQEDLNEFTETVTKHMQELYLLAKGKQTQSFYPCAKKINDAIMQLIANFPQDVGSDTVRSHIMALTLGATNLLEHSECSPSMGASGRPLTPGGPAGSEGGLEDRFSASMPQQQQQPRTQPEMVIQCAFDIAKGLKALVMSLERRQP